MQQKESEGKKFDKIFKENIDEIILPLLDKFLNIEIKTRKRLPEKLQTTTERKADYLAEITDKKGNKFVLHIEYQTENEAGMVYRVAEYHAIIRRKFKLPVKHLVLYLGAGKATMPKKLPKKEIFEGFELRSLNELDYEELIKSSVASEVVLAILANFKGRDPEAVLRLIVQQLKKVSKNKAALSKYLKQLTMLSRLRKLETKTEKTIDDMPITIDIQKDGLYLRGKAEGKAEGEVKGETKGRIEAAKNCLKKGFSIELTSELTGLSEEKVSEVAKGLDELPKNPPK